MANPENLLSDLDQLQNELTLALDNQDWERLGQLNARVRPTVEPLMAELDQGRIDAALVRERLEALNRFVAEADAAAVKARFARTQNCTAAVSVGQGMFEASKPCAVKSKEGW